MPTAPNLNKIKGSISNSLGIISNKSEDFMEISKIKYKIYLEENSMDDLYRDIGKDLFKIFKTSSHIDHSLLDYCNTLKKIENRIQTLQKKLDKINNKK
jgi:uncharacterized protein Yka (UPF0111/DUF47 family)